MVSSTNPASADFDGVSVSKSGTTVTVTLDCTLPYETGSANYDIQLNAGDTVVLTSKYAIGQPGACNGLYLSSLGFKFQSYPTPNDFMTLTGDVTFVSLPDASLGYDSPFVAYYNHPSDKGQHFQFLFVEPTGGGGGEEEEEEEGDSGGRPPAPDLDRYRRLAEGPSLPDTI
jgi:hypothetical protein